MNVYRIDYKERRDGSMLSQVIEADWMECSDEAIKLYVDDKIPELVAFIKFNELVSATKIANKDES